MKRVGGVGGSGGGVRCSCAIFEISLILKIVRYLTAVSVLIENMMP